MNLKPIDYNLESNLPSNLAEIKHSIKTNTNELIKDIFLSQEQNFLLMDEFNKCNRSTSTTYTFQTLSNEMNRRLNTLFSVDQWFLIWLRAHIEVIDDFDLALDAIKEDVRNVYKVNLSILQDNLFTSIYLNLYVFDFKKNKKKPLCALQLMITILQSKLLLLPKNDSYENIRSNRDYLLKLAMHCSNWAKEEKRDVKELHYLQNCFWFLPSTEMAVLFKQATAPYQKMLLTCNKNYDSKLKIIFEKIPFYKDESYLEAVKHVLDENPDLLPYLFIYPLSPYITRHYIEKNELTFEDMQKMEENENLFKDKYLQLITYVETNFPERDDIIQQSREKFNLLGYSRFITIKKAQQENF